MKTFAEQLASDPKVRAAAALRMPAPQMPAHAKPARKKAGVLSREQLDDLRTHLGNINRSVQFIHDMIGRRPAKTVLSSSESARMREIVDPIISGKLTFEDLKSHWREDWVVNIRHACIRKLIEAGFRQKKIAGLLDRDQAAIRYVTRGGKSK